MTCGAVALGAGLVRLYADPDAATTPTTIGAAGTWSSASVQVTTAGGAAPSASPLFSPRPAATNGPVLAAGTTGLTAALAGTDARRPSAGTPGKVLFGVGPGLDSDRTSPIAAGLGMLTTWYNGPKDLGFLRGWSHDLIPATYASGKAVHLIVYLNGTGPSGPVTTSFGTACGRKYPLSPDFLADTRQLATIFKGRAGGPPLYVTLFTEFQTYPCITNAWAASPSTTAYYKALKVQYLAALHIFHTTAPNALVSLGWGGWQDRYTDTADGGGRAMFPYFADVMRASDFESFQAMQSDSNVFDIEGMTQILGAYGPVMVAHYKPDNASQTIWTRDLHTIFTDAYMRRVEAEGLFAFSLMDQANLLAGTSSMTLVKDAITRYGAKPSI